MNLVALSRDGSTMSTVETRLPEEGLGSLVTLKFWACGFRKKQFSLSTVIYEPHRFILLVVWNCVLLLDGISIFVFPIMRSHACFLF